MVHYVNINKKKVYYDEIVHPQDFKELYPKEEPKKSQTQIAKEKLEEQVC